MVQHRRAAALAVTGCVLAAAASLAPGAPGAPGAASQSVTMTLGDVLGGPTSQDFPVVLEVDNPVKVRRVVRVVAGIRLECTSGGTFTVADGYRNLKVDRRGRFQVSWGPETQRNDDGTTTDIEGSISGKFSRIRDRVRGTWHAKATDRDGTGAVTDTCDSGRVTWQAKQ